MSSTFDHRAVFPVAPAATEPTNPSPNILEQPGVDTPKPWAIETIKILRTHTTMPDVRVATSTTTECNCEVRDVDGEAVVVVTEMEGCMLMIEGWQSILETVQVSGQFDAAIAACHLGRQIEGIRKLMVKIGRPVVMNKNEAAFMKSLFSDENIAWMASVWRHLSGY